MALIKDQRLIFDVGSEIIDLRAFAGFEQVETTPFEERGTVGIRGRQIEPLKRLRTTFEASGVFWDKNTVAKIEALIRVGTRMKVLGLHGWGDPLATGSVADFTAFETLVTSAPKQVGDLIQIELSVPSSYQAFVSPRPTTDRGSFWGYDLGPSTGNAKITLPAEAANLCAVVYVPVVPTGLPGTHDLKVTAKWNDGAAREAAATVADSASAALTAGLYFAELVAEPDNNQEDVTWLDSGERALPSTGSVDLGWKGTGIETLADAVRTICIGACRRARLS